MVNPLALKIRTKKLGVLLRDARLSSGKSMKDCGDAIGISSSRIGSFERGEKAPSLPELEAIAFYLDIPLDHFWSDESLSDDNEERADASNLDRLITIRHRIVGTMLRKTRLDANVSMKDLAETVGISPKKLKSYEMGEQPIPVTELEIMAMHLNGSVDLFRDKTGTVGKWDTQQRAIKQFLELPAELQEFISKPVNVPYIELAHRLSGMSVDQLRAVAEGLLEITL